MVVGCQPFLLFLRQLLNCIFTSHGVLSILKDFIVSQSHQGACFLCILPLFRCCEPLHASQDPPSILYTGNHPSSAPYTYSICPFPRRRSLRRHQPFSSHYSVSLLFSSAYARISFKPSGSFVHSVLSNTVKTVSQLSISSFAFPICSASAAENVRTATV